MKQFASRVKVEKVLTRGEPWDMTLERSTADYADPSVFLDLLLNGKTLVAATSNNFAKFDDPIVNRKLRQASGLTGRARYEAYGQLDVEIMSEVAPFAPMASGNARTFVSNRVGCFTWSNVMGINLAALCLK